MDFRTDKLLHGGDYNPEQWLKRPDILEKDIDMLEESGCNVVSLGIFSWSTLEPEEGVFHFGWLQEIIDKLYKRGISTILATPSGARPKWMADKYPEVLRVDETRHRALFGFRHNHCYTSPVYREKVHIINKKLAQEVATHPGVILWHISNEYGGECHCPLCREKFREWLKEKYGTIENLNKSWCTTFWSHIYNSFDQPCSASWNQYIHIFIHFHKGCCCLSRCILDQSNCLLRKLLIYKCFADRRHDRNIGMDCITTAF